MQPLISVVVPVFNGAEYVERCIHSLISQTISDLQIIIVNDGSTDQTEQICMKLKEQYSQITILTIQNSGVSVARNEGMKMATGQYLTFVDADDWMMPDMLEKLLESIQKTNADMACCEYRLCDAYYVPEPTRFTTTYTCYNKTEYIEKKLLNRDTRCWSKLYKQELIRDCKFPEKITIGEDLLFLTELLPNLNRTVYLDYQGYCYYVNDNGAMLKSFQPSYMDQITCWKVTKERIVANQPKMEPIVCGKLMMAIMLVVGKLSKADKETVSKYLPTCLKEIKEVTKNKDALKYVDKGYRIKITLFKLVPKSYLQIYCMWKQ